MMNYIYKVYMALLSNKIILIEGLCIVTFDIRLSMYKIWYVDEFKIPKLFDCCSDKETLKFKWNILMSKGGL